MATILGQTPPVTDFRQMADSLRHRILQAEFSPNEPFPSLRTLAKAYRVGIGVTRAAVDLLVKEGLLYRLERRGTFVRLDSNGSETTPADAGLRCANIVEFTETLPAFVRSDYFQGYTQSLDAHRIHMRVPSRPASVEQFQTIFSNQYAFQEQGCILVSIVDEPLFRWLDERKVPFVVQNNTQYPKALLRPHHSVVVNKVGGAFKAAQHLIRLGHRRIGYAGWLPGEPDAYLDVYQGYTAAMACAGLEPLPEDMVSINTDEPPMAYEPMLTWMKGRDLPSAMVVRTDSVALGILRAARTLGIRVPHDLSVVGFNDQVEAAAADPPLTTVAVPRVQLGRVAVETLMEAASGSVKAPISRVLECHLVKRASAAPPERTRT